MHYFMAGKPLILISNDDGYQAQGIRVLTDLMTRLGDVVVVAPDAPRSGAACAITPFQPVRLSLVEERAGLRVYSCSGSPVDCVKLASEQVVTRRPDLMVSGINHGDNASISMHYSGTVGAVLEACMKDIPAVAFSLRTRDQQCDFSPYEEVILQVARQVLEYGLPSDTCLNVNFPQVPKLLGTSVCRMARGRWITEWMPDEEPGKFHLAGEFRNLEPDAPDTDYWAMDHGMAAICPLHLDMTDYDTLLSLESLNNRIR